MRCTKKALFAVANLEFEHAKRRKADYLKQMAEKQKSRSSTGRDLNRSVSAVRRVFREGER